MIQQSIVIEATTEGTTPVDSGWFEVKESGTGSIQLLANQGSGDVEGAWVLYACNDYSDGGSGMLLPRADGTPVDIDDATIDIGAVTGTASNQLIRLGIIDFLFMKAIFTPTAGAGPIKAVFGGKRA